jgi:hypothetical protein
VKPTIRLKVVINALAQLLELDNKNKILFYGKIKSNFLGKKQVFVFFLIIDNGQAAMEWTTSQEEDYYYY